MRWDGQGVSVDDGALPGLQRIGFVRSVRTPQFEGITFHEVLCKSALNKVPERVDAAVPATRSTAIAVARTPAGTASPGPPTSTSIMDCGTDFDTQVVVKTNVADVLRRELRRPSWQRRDRRARHQHRPISACRGTLRADAGNHWRAGRFGHAVLDPHQGHAAAPRSAVDRRGRQARRRQRRGVAWPSATPNCTRTSSRERRRRRRGSA